MRYLPPLPCLLHFLSLQRTQVVHLDSYSSMCELALRGHEAHVLHNFALSMFAVDSSNDWACSSSSTWRAHSACRGRRPSFHRRPTRGTTRTAKTELASPQLRLARRSNIGLNFCNVTIAVGARYGLQHVGNHLTRPTHHPKNDKKC